MKKRIDRTLFWFKDGDVILSNLNDHFFGLGNLLGTLLNEVYEGKPIRFINIDFASNKTYEMYPAIPVDYVHYSPLQGGHLRYFGCIDFDYFNSLNLEDQNCFIWKAAHKYLQKACEVMKNKNLLNASDYALNKGLQIKLNPDFKVLEQEFNSLGKVMKASVWIKFEKGEMVSKFTLEKEGVVTFEQYIDHANIGMEFFLDVYKSIEVKDKMVVIYGDKEITYLPLKISIADYT